jgi:hypothetical protein
MALPKIDVPTYDIELPVSKKKIKYRPFLVKEQKNLLMAMEANDSETIHNAIRDVLNNCTLTDSFNIDETPIIDIEYYFLQLRAKSVGEIVESRYRCNNEVDGNVCNTIMEENVNLNDITVEMQPDVSPEIQITDKFVVRFKYPLFGVVKNAMNYTDEVDLTFHMIAQSIEWVFDGDQYYYAKEQTTQELIEFVESLNQEQFAKIENFFDNLPKLKKTLDITCKKCGFQHHIDIEGIESFFG